MVAALKLHFCSLLRYFNIYSAIKGGDESNKIEIIKIGSIILEL